MQIQVKGEWRGWDGNTVVQLMDGTKWKQEQYHYEYTYDYYPMGELTDDGRLQINGMSTAVPVTRLL